MKLTDLLKDIELGKVYTDKDKPPFKVNEDHHDKKEGKMAKYDAKEIADDAMDVFNMIDKTDDLPEWLEAKITKAADYMNSVKDYLTHHQPKNEGKLTEKFDIKAPGYSSREAKTVVDGALKQYSKDLKKLQYRVIKDWMSKAKAGVIDYFDLVRGFQTGDAKRANPYEVDFLMSVLSKDKIINRFRKYFGGKKGKRIR
jgi:hypothetical protein